MDLAYLHQNNKLILKLEPKRQEEFKYELNLAPQTSLNNQYSGINGNN